MTPASHLDGLGQFPALASNDVTRPSTADREHSSLQQRYELLLQNEKEKNEFIGVGAANHLWGSRPRLTIPGTPKAL